MNYELKIDKVNKEIEIKIDFNFQRFKVEKFGKYFHCDFQISQYESFGFALFYKDFGGKKYYPKEIYTDIISEDAKTLGLEYI